MKTDRRVDGSALERQIDCSRHSDILKAQRTPHERLRKGQDFRINDDVQRLIGGVAALAQSGEIGQAHADAAERWHRDYVMGVIGARDPEARGSGKAPDLHAAMLARTAAIGRCRVVRQSLGACGEIRLRMLLIDELSFSATAAKLLPGEANGRKKIAAQMSFLLEQLAEHYHLLDQARKCRTSPAAESRLS